MSLASQVSALATQMGTKLRDLSGVTQKATARSNLGLGSLAVVTPTGTPDGTKFLRDDNSWAVPAGATSSLPAGITGTGLYYPALNLYIPTGARIWKTRGKAALALTGQGLAKWAVIGASNVAGWNGAATARGASDYPFQMIKALEGAGYPVSEMPINLIDFNTYDTRATITGTWTNTGSASAIMYSTAPSGATFYTLPARISDSFAANLAGNGAAWTLKIDNIIPGTASTPLAGATVTVTHGTWTLATGTITPDGTSNNCIVKVTGMPKGSHYYVLTAAAAGAICFSAGLYVANSILVANFGVAGCRTAYYSDTSAWNTLLNNLLAWAPDTVFLDLGMMVNDYNNSISLATSQTNLNTTIAALQAAGIEVILVTPPPPTITASPWTPLPLAWQQMCYTVADGKGCWLIDNIDRDLSRANLNSIGLIGSDGFHPNEAGYEDISKSVMSAVGMPMAQGGWQPVVRRIASSVNWTIPSDVGKNGKVFFTLAGNIAITVPQLPAGETFTLYLIQDTTGSRVPTWAGATLDWLGAGAPTLSTAANAVDTIVFSSDGMKMYGYLTGKGG